MRHNEEDFVPSERRLFSTSGEPWRLDEREGRLKSREEGQEHESGDSVVQASFYSPPKSTGHRSSLTVRPAKVASVRSWSNLEPLPVLQSGVVRQGSPINDAVSAPLRSVQRYARYPAYRVNKYYRSAESSTSEKEGNGGSNLNATPSIASTHRYALRSRRPDAAPARLSNGAPIYLGQCSQVGSQNGFDPRAIPTTQQHQPEHKRRTYRKVSPPPAPAATHLYLAQARLPPTRCAAPKKLLVILDLNGTLLVRPSRTRPRDFIIRPGVHQLLDYLLDNHVVMVYSSARPENVEAMVDALVSKKRAKAFAAVWGRDKLELTPAQYDEKVQVYKKLERVWKDEHIQSTCLNGQRWSQANTVLIDDSHLKALSQPHNLIQIPEFTQKLQMTKEVRRREHEVLASIRAKLEELKWTHDVSRLILRWQTGQIEPPHATRLHPLPEAAGEENSEPASEVVARPDNPSFGITRSPELVDAQGALEKDMENLTTDPGRMNEPAISADEWKEFLK